MQSNAFTKVFPFLSCSTKKQFFVKICKLNAQNHLCGLTAKVVFLCGKKAEKKDFSKNEPWKKSGRKTPEKTCFFAKKQVFLSQKNKWGIMSKKRKKAMIETMCFFVYKKKKPLAKLTIFRKVG